MHGRPVAAVVIRLAALATALSWLRTLRTSVSRSTASAEGPPPTRRRGPRAGTAAPPPGKVPPEDRDGEARKEAPPIADAQEGAGHPDQREPVQRRGVDDSG